MFDTCSPQGGVTMFAGGGPLETTFLPLYCRHVCTTLKSKENEVGSSVYAARSRRSYGPSNIEHYNYFEHYVCAARTRYHQAQLRG